MLEFFDIFQELAQHPEILGAVPGIIRRDSDTGEEVDQFTGEPVEDEPEPEPEPEPTNQQTGGGSTNLSFVGSDFLNRSKINSAADELVTVAQQQGTTPSELASNVDGYVDNDIISEAENRFEPQPEPEPTNQGGDTGLGFDADGPLTPEQIQAIRNQDFVDDKNNDNRLLDPSEDTGLDTGNQPAVADERLREIANQDFVDNTTTEEINRF